MECRPNCGACCIAVSISSPLPGMPGGKPAEVRCIHLMDDMRCAIYETRPNVCRDFHAEELVCGHSREEAFFILRNLEKGVLPS
jgi:Fe-S-cluster containining protein